MAGYNTHTGIVAHHWWDGGRYDRYFVIIGNITFMTFDKGLYYAAKKLQGKEVTVEYFNTSIDPRFVSITETSDVVTAL